MLSIKCLKEYPNIIKKINEYLEPVFISDKLNLTIVSDAGFNKKFNYLISNNIPLIYTINYARFPEKTMYYIVELSKIMPLKDAFQILMNIPFKTHTLNDIYGFDFETVANETVVNEVIKLMHYNYLWSYVLLRKNFNIKMIKILLNKFYDFYFFEILYTNKETKDFNKSFELVCKNINETLKYRDNYYKLRTAKIPHTTSYYLSRNADDFLERVIDVANNGYYNVENLSLAMFFDENQISFLKLSRMGFVDEESFNKVKNNIFQNAFFEQLIDEKKFINNMKKVELLEPLMKRQKLNH